MTSLKIFFVSLVVTCIATVIFWAFPHLDIIITNHYYLGHNDFQLLHHRWAIETRVIEDNFLQWFAAVVFAGIVYKLIRPSSKLKAKFLLYILLVFLLIPGLLVNVVYKDHFHRPRPRQIQQYGRHFQYQLPWSTQGQCHKNCSFVCGDAAVLFSFWAFVGFCRSRWRVAATVAVLLLGGLLGYIRIGQGAHFFSDVILAACNCAMASSLLWWLCYAKHRPIMSDLQCERWLSFPHRMISAKYNTK